MNAITCPCFSLTVCHTVVAFCYEPTIDSAWLKYWYPRCRLICKQWHIVYGTTRKYDRSRFTPDYFVSCFFTAEPCLGLVSLHIFTRYQHTVCCNLYSISSDVWDTPPLCVFAQSTADPTCIGPPYRSSMRDANETQRAYYGNSFVQTAVAVAHHTPTNAILIIFHLSSMKLLQHCACKNSPFTPKFSRTNLQQ